DVCFYCGKVSSHFSALRPASGPAAQTHMEGLSFLFPRVGAGYRNMARTALCVWVWVCVCVCVCVCVSVCCGVVLCVVVWCGRWWGVVVVGGCAHVCVCVCVSVCACVCVRMCVRV